ncbi:MAG: DNA polymerase III subunit epsilon [Pseudomonadota bacterium]
MEVVSLEQSPDRQIVLDTETTGLEYQQGHRIIEIGCVELINRRLTGNNFHVYLDPDREIDEGAIAVHGITNEDLQGKPHFDEIALKLIEYLSGAELVIHNAPFDVGFLDSELGMLEDNTTKINQICTVHDTLTHARKMFPGQRNDLDSLCKRYEIDNSHRELHGALLDAEILADVYLLMTGGQTNLSLDAAEKSDSNFAGQQTVDFTQLDLIVKRASESELILHREWVTKLDDKVGGQSVFRKLEDKLIN